MTGVVQCPGHLTSVKMHVIYAMCKPTCYVGMTALGFVLTIWLLIWNKACRQAVSFWHPKKSTKTIQDSSPVCTCYAFLISKRSVCSYCCYLNIAKILTENMNIGSPCECGQPRCSRQVHPGSESRRYSHDRTATAASHYIYKGYSSRCEHAASLTRS